MSEGVSSARPARLIRFGETTGAMDEGLRVRFAALDEALATYRATCEVAYRLAATVETGAVLQAWSSGSAELGRWVASVGDAFMVGHAVEAYMGIAASDFDPEGVISLDTDDVVSYLDEEFRDDPFRGVSADGWTLDDLEVESDDPDALRKFLEGLGLPVTVADEAMSGLNDLLARVPRTATVTVTITESQLLITADGVVISRYSRAEATALLLFPGQAPADLVRASRWLGRVSGALDFATGAYTQWQADADLATEDRVLRAATEGLGTLGGGWIGGMAGGAAGGAAAGLVCGPGAPVCSSVLGVGGAILGAIGGSAVGGWLVEVLPWMDEREPRPGEYDLDTLTDELAQEDWELSEHFAPIDAATSLVASDLALAETSGEPDMQAELAWVLPDREELKRVAQGLPDPDDVPVTGTTTTTTPEPVPAPTPEPVPTSTPTGTTTTTPTPTSTPSPEPAPPPEPTPTPTGTLVEGR